MREPDVMELIDRESYPQEKKPSIAEELISRILVYRKSQGAEPVDEQEGEQTVHYGLLQAMHDVVSSDIAFLKGLLKIQ